jgi:hypothetical protein
MFTEGSNPLRFNSPCNLLVKPGFLGVCVSRTSTFQGQLFHHPLASTDSYVPTTRCPLVRASELLTFRGSFAHSIVTLFVTHHKSILLRQRVAKHLDGRPECAVIDRKSRSPGFRQRHCRFVSKTTGTAGNANNCLL